MKFADLLSQPLPSAAGRVMTESLLDGDDIDETCNGCAGEDADDLKDDLNDVIGDEEDDEIEGLSDDDLAALDAELSDDLVNVVATSDMDDEDDDVDMSPEEEMRADDEIALAATTMLVKDELNAEERVAFAKEEGAIAVNESFMTSTDVASLAHSDVMTEGTKYTNKQIIRFSKETKLKQLRALAVLICAKNANDATYVKYKKVMKVRKILRAKMEARYGQKADRMAKIYFKRLMNSKSPVLNKIGNKYSNN